MRKLALSYLLTAPGTSRKACPGYGFPMEGGNPLLQATHATSP